jgi:hypothetical protein
MADRYEAVAVRRYEDKDGNEKSAFTNIGVAWPMKERDGYSLRLHAMPAPEDGEYVILLMPPKPKEDQPQRQQSDNRGGGSSYGAAKGRDRKPATEKADSYGNQPANFSRDLDDDIPFAPEWR